MESYLKVVGFILATAATLMLHRFARLPKNLAIIKREVLNASTILESHKSCDDKVEIFDISEPENSILVHSLNRDTFDMNVYHNLLILMGYNALF